MRLIQWALIPIGFIPSLSFAWPIQIDVDKTLDIRQGGLTISQTIFFSSKNQNLTGSIDKTCNWRPITQTKPTLEIVLYHGDYKLMNLTSTNLGKVQSLKLKFEDRNDCEQFLSALETINASDYPRFQLSIDTHRARIDGRAVQQQWSLIDATTKSTQKKL